MDTLISVIVPVYNVEKYLFKCYTSIANQTYSNIEIILVDDGSKDDSSKICDDIAKKDSRVYVIHKKNEGLGFARNSGLEIARGKFVLFVDSDDYIEENMIQKLFERILQFKSDTSFCGYSVFFEEEKRIKKESYYKNNVFEGNEIIDRVLLEMVSGLPNAPLDSVVPMSVWHGLYSLDLIKKYKIRFPSERQYISEDIIFHIEYLRYSKRISYIGDNLYNYRLANTTSLTFKFNEDEFDRQKTQYIKITNELGTFLPLTKFELRTKRYFLGRVRTCVSKAFTYCKTDKNFKLRDYVIKIFNDDLVREVINNYPYYKNPIKIRIFNLCLKHKFYDGAIILMAFHKMKKNTRF